MPAPREDLRGVHRKPQPVALLLDPPLAALQRLDVLEGAVEAHRFTVEPLDATVGTHPAALAGRGDDLELEVEALAGFHRALDRRADDRDAVRRVEAECGIEARLERGAGGAVDAVRLVAPGQFLAPQVELPGTDVRQRLRLAEQPLGPPFARHVHGTADQSDDVAGLVAHAHRAVEHIDVVTVGVPQAVAALHAAAFVVDVQPLRAEARDVFWMDVLEPPVEVRTGCLCAEAEDLADGPGGSDHSGRDVALVNDAADRLGGGPEVLLAGAQPFLCELEPGDVVQGPDDRHDAAGLGLLQRENGCGKPHPVAGLAAQARLAAPRLAAQGAFAARARCGPVLLVHQERHAAALVHLLGRPAEDTCEALADPAQHQASVGIEHAFVHEARRHRHDRAIAGLALGKPALGALAPVDAEQDADDAARAPHRIAFQNTHPCVHPDPLDRVRVHAKLEIPVVLGSGDQQIETLAQRRFVFGVRLAQVLTAHRAVTGGRSVAAHQVALVADLDGISDHVVLEKTHAHAFGGEAQVVARLVGSEFGDAAGALVVDLGQERTDARLVHQVRAAHAHRAPGTIAVHHPQRNVLDPRAARRGPEAREPVPHAPGVLHVDILEHAAPAVQCRIAARDLRRAVLAADRAALIEERHEV